MDSTTEDPPMAIPPYSFQKGRCVCCRWLIRVGRAVLVIEVLVPEGLWQRVELLLPARPLRRRRYPGRVPVDDRAALAGIVFVLETGISWRGAAA